MHGTRAATTSSQDPRERDLAVAPEIPLHSVFSSQKNRLGSNLFKQERPSALAPRQDPGPSNFNGHRQLNIPPGASHPQPPVTGEWLTASTSKALAHPRGGALGAIAPGMGHGQPPVTRPAALSRGRPEVPADP